MSITKGERESVRRRDGYRCLLCGCAYPPPKGLYIYPIERRLRVHHIDGNEENNILDNLVTVCNPCHVHIHNNYKDSYPVYQEWFNMMIRYNTERQTLLSDRRKYVLLVGKKKV